MMPGTYCQPYRMMNPSTNHTEKIVFDGSIFDILATILTNFKLEEILHGVTICQDARERAVNVP